MSWSEPDDGGSPITGYTVEVRRSDDVNFSVDLNSCDMSSSSATSCVIPVATLRASPYNLEWGEAVYARVAALNAYGSSELSSEGNGAKIITAPSAPSNLANNPLVTSSTKIGLTWSTPSFVGGSTVTSYIVQFDNGSGGSSFYTLASGITLTSYTASGLQQGTTYQFKVQAVNGYGASVATDTVSVLAA